MHQQRLVGIIILGVAAFMLILSLFVLGWRGVSEGPIEGTFKLRSVERCYRGECRSADYDKSKMNSGKGKALYWSTLSTFIFGIIWLGILTAAAIVSGVAKTRGTIRAMCFTAFGFSIWMVLNGVGTEVVMGIVIDKSSVGAGFIVFFLAGVGGIVGGMLSAGAPAPSPAAAGGYGGAPGYAGANHAGQQPVGQQPPPAQQAAPACSQCGAPTSWMQQYSRWYCGNCRVYI